MINKVAFIIPYFGKMPPYFKIWKKTAEANPEFTFIFYSDLPLEVENSENIYQHFISFESFARLFRDKIGDWITLNSPYKLCDYRPSYGYVLRDDIEEYDFWGFIDVDTILGNLSNFVTDELLEQYDKLWFEGHFSLFRNEPKMNELFKRKYPHVLDYRYAFSTNYSCHFDENGTCVWAHEVDSTLKIRFYTDWKFLDTPSQRWEIGRIANEGYVIWNDGELTYHCFDNVHCENLMYLHLQKREMREIGLNLAKAKCFAIARDAFYELGVDNSYLFRSNDEIARQKFENRLKPQGIVPSIRYYLVKVKSGALKFRINMYVFNWKRR